MDRCLIAIPIGSMVFRPNATDILSSFAHLSLKHHTPVNITEDLPNYLLHFRTEADLEAVEAMLAIRTPFFCLAMIKWTPFYKCHCQPWRNPMRVEIDGLPRHMCSFAVIKPILSSFCEVVGFKFDEKKQKACVSVFSSSTFAIPTSGLIAFPVNNLGVDVAEVKQVTLVSKLIPNKLDDKKTIDEYVRHGYPRSVARTATENGVDIDLLVEVYEQQAKVEDDWNGVKRRVREKEPNDSDAYDYEGLDWNTCSVSSSDSDELWDREPACWKRGWHY